MLIKNILDSKISELDKSIILEEENKKLEKLSADERIIWAINNLPKKFVLSSSFGIQSVVSLHLLTRYLPEIPIILIDTGYMFPETYNFIDKLKKKLNLNLKVFRAKKSAAWQEARYGKLWEQGLEGIEKYNLMNKVKPFKKALKKLKIKTWFAGLRNQQSKSRKNLKIISIQNKIFKILPILDWNNKKIYYYIKKNNLEFHPLWNKGYLSVGDIHMTNKWKPGQKAEDTRFLGLKRECGIHELK